MDFRILGPLEVISDTGPVALPRGRGRALLALLVLRAGDVVAAEGIIDALWGPSPPRTASKGLHNLVSDLRRRLRSGQGGNGVRRAELVTAGSGYVLVVEPERIDANRFRRLLSEAVSAPADERAARLRTALQLWRGAALADFVYEPFAQVEITALEDLRLAAIEERIDADLSLGRHAELVGELEGLVPEHPFRERMRAQLMLALYRSGRQADALEAYQTGRRTLVEDLGIEPGQALRDLERAILRQDPALEHWSGPASPAGRMEALTGVRPLVAAERKTVTVACVELDEAAAGGGDDPERSHRLGARAVATATAVLERHGGTVQGPVGGVLVAVFGIPSVHEDDALRAVRAAVELREAVAARSPGGEDGGGVEIVARAGLATGEVIVGNPPEAASGDVVRAALRLQQAAAGGEVIVDEATRRLLGDAARVESVATLVLDRRGRPSTVWRLVRLASGSGRPAPDRTGPLVGRTTELSRLHAALQGARRTRQAALWTVVGEPGVGKSRLALEFAGSVAADVRVLSCRCPAYGDGITFWPLREIVLQVTGRPGPAGIAALLAGQDDAAAAAAQIAGAIGRGDEPGSGHELFPAVRRLFEAVVRDRPAAVVVDDVHWAQPTFLDLLDYLAESVEGPLLIVCLARPELLDERPGWVGGDHDPACISLRPLGRADSERLAAQWLDGRLVPDEVVAEVIDMAQGNPLFIEQLLATLRGEGRLELPPSVHALLAARLDRLGPGERDLLRRASVIGAEFSTEALTVLSPDEARRTLGRHLAALQDKEFVRPTHRSFLGSKVLAFRHVLIQQAAYRSATRALRAELHERLAAWLEQREALEFEEVVAYHLEQAHSQRRQLGLAGEATHDLAVRAGERLARAGLRAYQRFDMTAAGNLLSRARGLLPGDDPRRYEVLRRLSQAYPTLGRLEDAEAVLAEMLEHPRGRHDASSEQRLRLEQLRVRVIAGPDPVRHEAIHGEVERAVEILEPLGDDAGMSQACYVLATMYLREGRLRDLEAVARRGLDHAQRSGDLREVLGALWWPAWALVAGRTPVAEAIPACEALLAISREHVGVLTDLARLLAMRGEFDEARRLCARARRHVVERARVRRPLTVLAQRRAEVEILAGDLDAAERALQAAAGIGLDVGERDQASQVAAELSRLLAARDAAAEAARFATVARKHAPAESVAAQALWRAASARVQALRGEASEAERLAREAIALVPADLLSLRAGLWLDLAGVLLAGGSPDGAREAREHARNLYGLKGSLAGVRRCA